MRWVMLVQTEYLGDFELDLFLFFASFYNGKNGD